MMITTEGIIIQLRMDDISTLGRITSGVKMINLDDNVKVAPHRTSAGGPHICLLEANTHTKFCHQEDLRIPGSCLYFDQFIVFPQITNLGRVYRIKAYEIPEASRTARGIAIVGFLL